MSVKCDRLAAPVAAYSFEGSAATPLKPPKPEAAPKVEAEPKIGVGDDAYSHHEASSD
jgi:hypothetical protein